MLGFAFYTRYRKPKPDSCSKDDVCQPSNSSHLNSILLWLAAAVTKSLQQPAGVKEVKVNLEPPEAVVVYYPSKVSPAELINAVKNAGYTASIK